MKSKYSSKLLNDSLLENLKDYGLNPAQWTITRPVASKKDCLIVAKKDPSFVLLGKFTQKYKKLKWDSLEVVSL